MQSRLANMAWVIICDHELERGSEPTPAVQELIERLERKPLQILHFASTSRTRYFICVGASDSPNPQVGDRSDLEAAAEGWRGGGNRGWNRHRLHSSCGNDGSCFILNTGLSSSGFQGAAVSLSGDGQSLAIGAPHGGGGNQLRGYARTFKYDETQSRWRQFGNTLEGECKWNSESGLKLIWVCQTFVV